MPQLGWFELLTIVIIAILVIGPKEFPIVLNKIGNWVGSVKRYFSEMQKNLNEVTEIDKNILEPEEKDIEKKENEKQ